MNFGSRALAAGQQVLNWMYGQPGAPIAEAAGRTADRDAGWTPIGGGARRDLNPALHDRAVELAGQAWNRQPLARALVELPIAYLTAGGVRLRVEDETAQQALDRWWSDPITDFPRRLGGLMRDGFLTGEVAWPIAVGPNGSTRLGWLDPRRIASVVTDPDNASLPIVVEAQSRMPGEPPPKYRVALALEESELGDDARGLREMANGGDILYWQLGAPAGATRGLPELLPALDWLDGYERNLWAEAERVEYQRSFVWDVTLANATPDQIEKRAGEISAPQPGSVRVHNESESWQSLSPDIDGADLSEVSRLLRNHILAAVSIPEHWIGGAADVNRATAAEMGSPAYRGLEARQRQWTEILRRAAEIELMHRFPESADTLDVVVEWPPLVVEDASVHAAALAQAVSAAAVAQDRGLLSDRTAVGLVGAVAERLGIEVDLDKELVAARADAARREDGDYGTPPADADDDTGDG